MVRVVFSIFVPLFLGALLFAAGAGDVLVVWVQAGPDAGRLAADITLARLAMVAILVTAPPLGPTLGFTAGGLVMAAQARLRDPQGRGGLGWSLLAGLAALPPLAFAFLGWAFEHLGRPAPPASAGLMPWGLGVGAGLAAAFAWLRYVPQQREGLFHRLSRRSQLERNRKTDVREIDRILPQEIGRYDPERYFRQDRGLFVGLDEHKKPIYIPDEDWRLSHVLLSGRTRSGKGVAAQILLSQAIARGEFVVILDPKGDEWMPHVFHAAAQKAGQSYHFLDLRPGRPPQFNPFAGADAESIEAMLIAGFSLAEKGEAADFYRLADRKAAREAASIIARQDMTAAEALAERGGIWMERAAGFHAALEEMADLPAVNAAAGLDLEAMATSGGCLYVVGDMGNTRVVRQQRMLLVRLMMLAKQFQAEGVPHPLMTVFADEFKVHISRPFMTSLGAAAGWGMHCILAFQSLQDLADVPADLDRDAVRGAVMENCAIQLSYRIKDPETAEWLAASTGKILVDDEIRRVERNVALTETVDPTRQVRLAERYFIDENMLMNLPKGCAVLAGVGRLARFCYTAPIVTDKDGAAVTPVPAAETTSRPSVTSGAMEEASAGDSSTASRPSVAQVGGEEDWV